MTKREESKSLVEGVYQNLRAEILAGTLGPGTRLQPSVLGKQYSSSTTVVREALTMLSGDRLVEASPGRGFFVPHPDRKELQDLTLLRCHNESLALRLAIENGDVDWESELIGAHHRLAQTPRRTEAHPDQVSPDWLAAHRVFHAKLIEPCGNPNLMEVCDRWAASTELYRAWTPAVTKPSHRDTEGEHQAILQATLDRDVDLAVALLVKHYETTQNNFLENWHEEEAASEMGGVA